MPSFTAQIRRTLSSRADCASSVLRRNNCAKYAADADFRLPVADLERAIAEDRAAGKRPFCVAATAGTTNTGAIDPLNDLADLCEREGLWLHVDGAYGASACLTAHRKQALAGIERAHSLTWDAHKWMFQPIECGILLVRDRHWLGQTFKDTAHFLTDAEDHSKDRGWRRVKLHVSGHSIDTQFSRFEILDELESIWLRRNARSD